MNTLLITLAAAPAQPGGGGMMQFGFLILIIVIFWLFIIRPQQKKQKEEQKKRNALTVGDDVVTIGGIYGTIKAIDEASNILTVEVAKDVKIRVDRNSLNPVMKEAAK